MYIVLRISLLLILTKCNYYLHLFFCHQSPVWVHSTGKQVCNRWYDHDLVWKVNPWQVQLLGSGTLGSITTFWESVVCQCLYETELYSFDCTLTCVSFGLISIFSFCLLFLQVTQDGSSKWYSVPVYFLYWLISASRQYYTHILLSTSS